MYLLDRHRGVACCQAPAEVLQQLLKFYETLWELMQAQGSHLASDGTYVIKHSYTHTHLSMYVFLHLSSMRLI